MWENVAGIQTIMQAKKKVVQRWTTFFSLEMT
jgi:hypothetical protein